MVEEAECINFSLKLKKNNFDITHHNWVWIFSASGTPVVKSGKP